MYALLEIYNMYYFCYILYHDVKWLVMYNIIIVSIIVI